MTGFLATAWENTVQTASYLLAYHYALVLAPAIHLGLVGWWTQIANGGLALAVALLGVPPVANLFVGTYLWKIGFTHAGIVAFFCAATAAPTRWRLYSRMYGQRGAVRFVAVLLFAALFAGLATAGIFGVLELSIHYKLIPQQLWRCPDARPDERQIVGVEVEECRCAPGAASDGGEKRAVRR